MNQKEQALAVQAVMASVRKHYAGAMDSLAKLELKTASRINTAANWAVRAQLERDLRFARHVAEAWDTTLKFVSEDLGSDVDAEKEFPA
jgi:hypothetical protein